jgi:RimJ/RimL family protein N-acetyltransferase
MLRALRLAPRVLAGMARRGAALVDGQGTRRVADALMPPSSITLRPAHECDCADVHAWRNDASVREQSHDARPIAFDDHRRWFAAALADPQRVLLIGEDAQGPVGVVRFDLSPPQATVSVYLVPARQAAGLGTPLIAAASRWMREHRPQVARLVAEILPRNVASARAFERAGYVADRHLYVASLRE